MFFNSGKYKSVNKAMCHFASCGLSSERYHALMLKGKKPVSFRWFAYFLYFCFQKNFMYVFKELLSQKRNITVPYISVNSFFEVKFYELS